MDSYEGGGCGAFEAVFKNGKWCEVNDYTLDVYVENDAEFRLLAEKMNDKEWLSSSRIYKYEAVTEEHFVMLFFGEVTEEETNQILDGIIGKMATALPQTELFCILVHDMNAGSGIEKKAIAKDGVATFQEITPIDSILSQCRELEHIHRTRIVDDYYERCFISKPMVGLPSIRLPRFFCPEY